MPRRRPLPITLSAASLHRHQISMKLDCHPVALTTCARNLVAFKNPTILNCGRSFAPRLKNKMAGGPNKPKCSRRAWSTVLTLHPWARAPGIRVPVRPRNGQKSGASANWVNEPRVSRVGCSARTGSFRWDPSRATSGFLFRERLAHRDTMSGSLCIELALPMQPITRPAGKLRTRCVLRSLVPNRQPPPARRSRSRYPTSASSSSLTMRASRSSVPSDGTARPRRVCK